MKRPVPTTTGAADTSFESLATCDEFGDASGTLIMKGDTVDFGRSSTDVCTLSFEMDTDATVTDEEVVWVLLLTLLLLTTEAEEWEKAGAVRLLAADVTEDAAVVTEDAAWTTEDCTREATDPKNEPIPDIPSEKDPDEGLEPEAELGLSATTFSAWASLVETMALLLVEPLERM